MKRLLPVVMGFELLFLSSAKEWCTSPTYCLCFTRDTIFEYNKNKIVIAFNSITRQ
jgi:hypothetical protein